MILHDQHMHSSFSEDSKENIIKYIEMADKEGCEYFVTTEHLDFNINDSGYDWDVDYDSLLKTYSEIKDKYKVKLLLGVEMGYLYNKKDNERLYKIMDKYNFDLINLSIHCYKTIDFYFIDQFKQYGIDKTMEYYFNLMLEAVKEFKDFDVLSHIDYSFKTVYLNDNSASIKKYENIIKEIFKEVIKRDKVVEINTKVQESINNDEHTRYILRLYKECGGKHLTLSSDAHSISRYKSNFDRYLKIIKEEGFDHLCYFVKRKRYEYKLIGE